MLQIAYHIALAHLAVSLVPGQSLSLVSAGIAGGGMGGGLRVMAGVTAAKVLWALLALAGLPLALAAGPALLSPIQIAGGVALIMVGARQLVRAARPASEICPHHGTIRRGFAGGLVNPATSIFFLSVFPAIAATASSGETAGRALCVAAVAVSAILGLLPWLAIGLMVRRCTPWALRALSGTILIVAGVALAACALT